MTRPSRRVVRDETMSNTVTVLAAFSDDRARCVEDVCRQTGLFQKEVHRALFHLTVVGDLEALSGDLWIASWRVIEKQPVRPDEKRLRLPKIREGQHPMWPRLAHPIAARLRTGPATHQELKAHAEHVGVKGEFAINALAWLENELLVVDDRAALSLTDLGDRFLAEHRPVGECTHCWLCQRMRRDRIETRAARATHPETRGEEAWR